MSIKTERIFYNGNIITTNELYPIAEGFAVNDGKFTKIGNNNDIKGLRKNEQEMVDLEGKTVIPGINDCHMHLLAYSFAKEKTVVLKEVSSIDELVKNINTFIEEKEIKENDWIMGSGWNHDRFPDKRVPDRHLLDEISKDNPIRLIRMCFHICAVNTKALELAGIDKNTPDPEGGQIDRDEEGNPTGVLRETAMELVEKVIPPFDNKDEIKDLLVLGCNRLAAVGITSVHTDDFPFVADKKLLFDAFKELDDENKLPVRVILQIRAASEKEVEDYNKMGLKSWDTYNKLTVGPIKIIVDGSLGSRTAALREPYSDDPKNSGIMVVSEEKLDKIIKRSFELDFDVTAHAIGDKTMAAILDSYERHENIFKSKGMRPSIIHCQIAGEDILKKYKKLDIIANIQLIFLHSDWSIAEDRVGPERVKYSYCWRTYMDKGIKCAGSSDAPVEEINPLWGIYAGVTRKDLTGKPEGGWMPEESIDVNEAIKLFTKYGAYLSHEEDIKGMIIEDQLADFVVLEEDITKIDPHKIKDVKVLGTYVDGKKIF